MNVEFTLMAGLCIAIIFSMVSAQSPKNYGECTTPESKTGRCIHLTECPEIFALYNKPGKTRQNVRYLRSTQCGYVNRNILVCCNDEQKETESSIVGGETNIVKMPSPAKRECGRVLNDRIIGGTETKFDEYPWTALLEYKQNGVSIGFKCGGSLINERYVVTAAHCMNSFRPFSVRLGEWDTSTDPDCVTDRRNKKDCADPHIDVRVERIIVHPNYAKWSGNQHYDIALIRLVRKVDFTFFIQPICMPPQAAIKRDGGSNLMMSVTGWGRTENRTNSARKLKLEIATVSNADCQAIYSPMLTLIPSQMCAGGNKGQDSCRNDSGGPLMAVDTVNNKPYTYLAGVISFGPSPCGMEGLPGVYTKVSELRNWILENAT